MEVRWIAPAKWSFRKLETEKCFFTATAGKAKNSYRSLLFVFKQDQRVEHVFVSRIFDSPNFALSLPPIPHTCMRGFMRRGGEVGNGSGTQQTISDVDRYLRLPTPRQSQVRDRDWRAARPMSGDNTPPLNSKRYSEWLSSRL